MGAPSAPSNSSLQTSTQAPVDVDTGDGALGAHPSNASTTPHNGTRRKVIGLAPIATPARETLKLLRRLDQGKQLVRRARAASGAPSQATPCRASNGHVRPFHDHAPKQAAPSRSAPSPNATTLDGVVTKMKIQPTSATRLGSG